MPVVERSLLINAPRDALFDLAQDYGLRLKWDPFLREMRFLDGADEAAVGVRVSVRAWTGLTMVAEYLTLNRPQLVAMKMVRGPFIFRQFAGSWQFQPHAGGSTEVTFRYQFETRWPGCLAGTSAVGCGGSNARPSRWISVARRAYSHFSGVDSEQRIIPP